MMNEFIEKLGERISEKQLRIARVKKIALALNSHPYAQIQEVRRKENGDEIIVAKLDIEVPSSPITEIMEFEEIAIICSPNDISWPEVLALRIDFPVGLPHTNARIYKYPVSICYTEEVFLEVKYRFNAFSFIEQIRKWFELTALNEVHSEDQPLEPFFITKGYAIVRYKDIVEDDNQNPIFSIIKLSENLIKIEKGIKSKDSICCLKFQSQPITHGAVRKQPSCLSDLLDIVKFDTTNLLEVMKLQFNSIFKNSDVFKLISNQKLGLLVEIPKKRKIKDSIENFDLHLFITDKTISEIGIELGIWEKAGGYFVPIISSGISKENIGEINIEYYSIIYDFDRDRASFINNMPKNIKKFAIIGVGALGSQVINNFGRIGFGKWLIIDHDTLLPHNLGRHFLSRQHLGLKKAESISKEMNSMLGEENHGFADSITKNFLADDLELIEKIRNVDAIIDMSTSIAVERKISLDLPKDVTARRITSFLNPKGTDMILIVEDKERKTRLDLLEMEYYRHISTDLDLSNHLKNQKIGKIRYASNSCRDISSRINQEDISLHSAIATKAIRKSLSQDNGLIKIWMYDQENLDVKVKEFKPSEWEEVVVKDWKLIIDKWVFSKIYAYREKKLPKETGGVLIGSYDFERKLVYVVDSLPAPKDSIEKTTTFMRGVEGLPMKVEEIKNVTNGELNYIGEWHSHPPKASTDPSKLDIIFFNSLQKELFAQGYPTLMMIVGDQDYRILISES